MHRPLSLAVCKCVVSFQRAGGMCSMLSMGSRKTVLAKQTSGIKGHTPHGPKPIICLLEEACHLLGLGAVHSAGG